MDNQVIYLVKDHYSKTQCIHCNYGTILMPAAEQIFMRSFENINWEDG